MNIHLTRILVMAGGLALAVAVKAAPQFTNGSFETDPFSFNGTLDLGGSNPLTGWTTLSNGTYPWGLPNSNTYNAGPTPYGNQWVIVGDFGEGGTWIEQTVAGFTVGKSYTLSFALASEYSPASALGSPVDVNIMGLQDNQFRAPLRGANYWDTCGTFNESFVANDTSLTFRFTGLADDMSLDAGIDNVQILSSSHVPDQASSLILLSMGMLALGLISAARFRQIQRG
jgi:hypothetical protein